MSNDLYLRYRDGRLTEVSAHLSNEQAVQVQAFGPREGHREFVTVKAAGVTMFLSPEQAALLLVRLEAELARAGMLPEQPVPDARSNGHATAPQPEAVTA